MKANEVNKNVMFNEIKVINIESGEKVYFLFTGKINGKFASITVDMPYYGNPYDWDTFLKNTNCEINDLVCEAVENKYEIQLNDDSVIEPTRLFLDFTKKLEIGSTYVINDDTILEHNEKMKQWIDRMNAFNKGNWKFEPKTVNGIMFYNLITL